MEIYFQKWKKNFPEIFRDFDYLYNKESYMSKKVIRLTESELKRYIQKIISEQSSSNVVSKEYVASIIKSIENSMSADWWRDADDMMSIYQRLLPLKGKVVPQGQPSSKYTEMNADEQKSQPALHWFNTFFPRIVGNKFGMGGPFNFIQLVDKVGNTNAAGGEEVSKNGKFTTRQIKIKIMELVKNG